MDINALILDLHNHKEELSASIEIAFGLGELHKADRYVAHEILEIKGLRFSDDPFQQLAVYYSLPMDEVILNVRKFTNKQYKILVPADSEQVDGIEFESGI